jgi:hypothetical protein
MIVPNMRDNVSPRRRFAARPRRRTVSATLFVLSVICAPCLADTPHVEVSNIRRVFHNGEHNAFTDLIEYLGRYYLAFRSCPDGHMVHPTSKIIILASDELLNWQEVHRFNVAKRDTRDPHFLVFKGRLFVYTGTWYSGETTLPREEYDLNLHLGYAAYSDDGATWTSPVMLDGTFGHYIWRAAAHDGVAYLCGRHKKDFEVGPRGEGHTVQSIMLASDDGLIWRQRAVFQPNRGDETAFLFEPGGDIVAIGRSGSEPAQLLRSTPPYDEFTRQNLPDYIGGPLLARWGDRYIVGGRKNVPGVGPKTAMQWLVGDELFEFVELPSGGDNSYPGFLALDDTHGVMSWYSSHEKDADGKTITAIYMADLEIAP